MTVPRKRIILASGVGYDKRLLYEITKKMASDWDIRKISLFGPVLWSGTSLVPIIGTIIPPICYFMSKKHFDIGRLLKECFNELVSNAGMIACYLIVLCFIIWITDQLEKAKKLFEFFRTFFGSFRWWPKGAWQNLNYWYTFSSNPSDCQPLTILANCSNNEIINMCYPGSPYYDYIFINAIYLKFENVKKRRWELRIFRYRFSILFFYVLIVFPWISIFIPPVSKPLFWVLANLFPNLEKHFPIIQLFFPVISLVVVVGIINIFFMISHYFRFHFKFYRESSNLTDYDTRSIDPQNESNKKLLARSLNGYGIYYLSKFLADFFGKESQFSIISRKEYIKKGEERNWETVENFLNTCIPPVYSKGNAAEIDITICGFESYEMEEEGEKNRCNSIKNRLRKKPYGKKDGIRFPVKKFVGLNKYRGKDFPLPLLSPWKEDDIHYLLLGGCEHQLFLRDIIRHLQNDGYTNIALLENAFMSNKDKDTINITSESFVSAVLTGEKEIRGNNVFLLLRHQFSKKPDRWAHIILGFSAQATKMGFIYWFRQYQNEFAHLAPNTFYNISYEISNRPEKLDMADFFDDPRLLEPGQLNTLEFNKPSSVKNVDGYIGYEQRFIWINRNQINDYTPDNKEYNGKLFFYSHKIRRKQDWLIKLTPPDCIFSIMPISPDIPILEKLLENDKSIMLFSVGVILLVNDKILLLQEEQKDQSTAVNPDMWTCPMGWCDMEPVLTAYKKFYEEVIIFNINGKPVFIKFKENTEPEMSMRTYKYTLEKLIKDQEKLEHLIIKVNSLRKKNHLKKICVKHIHKNLSKDDWEYYQANIHHDFDEVCNTVVTQFGKKTHPERFFTYWDKNNRTLEMRLILKLILSPGEENRLIFLNSKGNELIGLFSREEFQDKELVSVIAEFRETWISENFIFMNEVATVSEEKNNS